MLGQPTQLYADLLSLLFPSILPNPCMQGPILFRHAAFVPPGYASLLFAHLYEPASCPLPTTLFAGFRRFMLGSFGLHSGGSGRAAAGAAAGLDEAAAAAATDSNQQPLVVRLISRRPGPGKARMARQIGNEDELLSALRALSSDSSSADGSEVGPLAVSLLDFAGLPREADGMRANCLGFVATHLSGLSVL